MSNLLSYCGLVDAKIRASDKDLPVQGLNSVVLSDDGMSEGNQMFSTLEATIKAVKEFNAEIIVGIDNTFLSPYILVC